MIEAGVDLQLIEIDAPGRVKLFTLLRASKKLMRPPTAAMWADPSYDPQRFKLVGKGIEGL